MRDILAVIDMQNDFISGALGTKEAEAIVPRVVEEIGKYRQEDILATRDTHTKEYLKTPEGKHLPVVHCVKGTPGWEIHPLIAAALGEATVIDKPTFGSPEFAGMIREMAGREHIRLTMVGLCTDICVVSNALLVKAISPESEVRVIADACAGVTPESHRAALTVLEMCQAEVVRT